MMADTQLALVSPAPGSPVSSTPPSTPTQTATATATSNGISLRAVVTLGQALIKGDSNIHSLLQTLAEKGKTRHDDRKKRKRTKKEKKEAASGAGSSSSKSSTWSATSLAAATAEAKAAAAAELAAKKTPPKRKRSVSDARMFASDDAHVVHRDRSRSAPSNIAPLPSGPAATLPPGTPRHKDAIVRSHSASSPSGLMRDLSKPKKMTASTGTSPTVHHLNHHHHSSSAIPTAAAIKKSPRMRGRSSSVCGSSSSSPIRRAAPTTASATTATAISPATAALLSPRTERLPLPSAEGLCAHGRPLHHHQSRSSLLTPSHHHTCRHARSVPTSVEFDAIPTTASPSLTPRPAVPMADTNARGNNQWAMGDEELEYILSTIEESATAANSTTLSPFLTATMTNSTSTSPVSQSATATVPERRPSLDMMHIADTMQRVSIDCKDDDFDPMRFLDMELATATAAVAAASAHQQSLAVPTPAYPPNGASAMHQSFGSYVSPQQQQRYHGHQQLPQQRSMHVSSPQGLSTLTRSVSQPQAFHPPAPVAPSAAAGADAFARQTRCNSDVGFFSSLLLKEDEQQMRELYMAIDDASTPFDLGYFD